MIAVDTNILVHAHRRDSEDHRAAASVVRALAESPQPWAIPWPCIHEFLSIVTRPRYFKKPSTMAQAERQVQAWMRSPSLRLLAETAVHWPTLLKVLGESEARGANVHDAKIAAICLDHGVTEILSADGRFAAPSGLRVRDPLA